MKEQKVVRDYLRNYDNIWSIAISSDDKHLWTNSGEPFAHVKQFSVRNGKMVKDFGPIFGNDPTKSVMTTSDNNYLFAASYGGKLKQVSLKSQKAVNDYGEVHDHGVSCMETTRDSKWLIICTFYQDVIRFSVEHREFDKVLGQVCNYKIREMKITADGEKMLLGYDKGYLLLISLRNGKVIKDFGKVHSSATTGIMITEHQKFFFTSTEIGEFKQWNYEDNTLVRDHGEFTDPIVSLC